MAETDPAHPRQEKGRPGEWRSPREEGGKKGPGQTSQQHQQLKDSVQKGSENTRQSVSLEGNATALVLKDHSTYAMEMGDQT